MTRSFGDRLAEAVRARGPLCVGLDPYPDRIPELFGAGGVKTIERFAEAVIATVAGRAAALKPQIALFEPWGPEGLAALARLCEAASEAGLLVVLDAKRGDIGATAAGYADAYLGPDAWLAADAVTVNPYMGLDTLEPWLERADARAKGLFVLLRTSNPGAADFQSLDAAGAPVWIRVAERLAPLVETRVGESGWSSIGVVMGATAPEEAARARSLLPSAWFLVPGYGAQGAGAQDALASAQRGLGALVNASRSVLYPKAAERAGDPATWRAAIEAAVEAANADLKAALAAQEAPC